MISRLTWNFDLDCYKSLIPDIELFNWEKDSDKKIDLLVFPGGEDVSLEFYCSQDTIRNYSNMCYTNRERDDYEMNILDHVFSGRLKVNKLFGVCRGMQFLNVMFDGKLFPDLHSANLGHSRVHNIYHKMKSNLEFLETVNSLHHQGLREIGRYDRRGNRIDNNVIATDKTGNVPEIVSWSGNRILGVQFHPEYFWDSNPDKAKFTEFLNEWVAGNTTILV